MTDGQQHRRRQSYRTVLAASLVWMLGACGILPAAAPEGARTQYESKQGYVRVERIEPGAPDNAHPTQISSSSLRAALATLHVKGTVSTNEVALFTEEELTEFVPRLAAALAKAGPKEDLTFTTASSRGLFATYSPRFFTSARLFVRDQQLNVIFGVIHQRLDYSVSPVTRPARVVAGSRAQPVEIGWSLKSDHGQLAEKRPDWLTFDIPRLTAVAAEKGKDARAPAGDRYKQLEEKLSVLDRLKENGLVTEDEYRERRRALLQDL